MNGSKIDMATMAAGRFEPRFLEIPGINTSALGLKNLGEGKDRVFPVDPIPRFLRAQGSYSPDEFLGRVRPQADKWLGFDDQPMEKADGGDAPHRKGSAGA